MGNLKRHTWNRIHSLLRDRGDVSHIYQVCEHQLDYFVTVDRKTILIHREALAANAYFGDPRCGFLLAPHPKLFEGH